MRFNILHVMSLGVALAGCFDGGDEVIDPGAGTTVTRTVEEIFSFETLEQMTLESDLVIEGEVLDVRAGREVSYGDGMAEHMSVAVVRVHRVVHGAIEADEIEIEFPRHVVLLDHGVRRIVRTDGANEYEPGEVGYYYLRETVTPGTYRTHNSQSRILFEDDVVVSPLINNDPLHAQITGTPAATFRVRMVTAARQVNTGQVTPATPAVNLPPNSRSFERTP